MDHANITVRLNDDPGAGSTSLIAGPVQLRSVCESARDANPPVVEGQHAETTFSSTLAGESVRQNGRLTVELSKMLADGLVTAVFNDNGVLSRHQQWCIANSRKPTIPQVRGACAAAELESTWQGWRPTHCKKACGSKLYMSHQAQFHTT